MDKEECKEEDTGAASNTPTPPVTQETPPIEHGPPNNPNPTPTSSQANLSPRDRVANRTRRRGNSPSMGASSNRSRESRHRNVTAQVPRPADQVHNYVLTAPDDLLNEEPIGAMGGSPPAERHLSADRQARGPPSSPSSGTAQSNHYNWQATKTSIKDRLAFMFNNEVMADVHFVVGKGQNIQRIPAHKFVLSIGSAVFDAMFNGGMATTNEEIELPDIEPSAFLALLKFLYSDEVQIGPETVMTTLYTAKKYAVPALENACVDFLKRNVGSDNAFMLLTQARLFDEPQLAALCLEMIDKNTSEATQAEGFTDIDLDTLCVVLERDTLGIRESKLFSAVCRWAEAECLRQNLTVKPENQRRVLSRALSLIRFPLMTVEEFAMGPAQSKILTDHELVQLFLHFTVNPKPPVNFLDIPRCCLTGKEQVVSRFMRIESRWGYSGTSDRIR